MILILASISPRRKQLLTLGGWEFSVLHVEVDESVRPGERPESYVLRISVDKAKSARAMMEQYSNQEALVIAADTAVVHFIENRDKISSYPPDESLQIPSNQDYEIIGKPADAVEAESILRRLRGRTHQVYSGVTVMRVKDSAVKSDVCITDVPMRAYSDEEISRYIVTGDPFDKAGAYAIQHEEFNPVQNLQGCYANVMGLPLCHLTRLLRRFNLLPAANIPEACQESLSYECSIFNSVLDSGS